MCQLSSINRPTVSLFFSFIAILFFYTSCNTAQDPQSLFKEYYRTPEFTPASKGIRHMLALKSVYEDSDFETAIRLLEKVKQNPKLRVYLGICHLEMEQTSKAIPLFESLLSEKAEVKHPATWYLALCHLKEGDVGSCRTELTKLSGYPTNSPFKQKGKELLGKL